MYIKHIESSVVVFLLYNAELCTAIQILSFSHIIQKQKDPAKAHQVKLETIVKALKWLELDMDIDEVFFISISDIFRV